MSDMRLNGGVKYTENGMKTALKGMQVQSALVDIANDNINGFDKVGYQRKEAVMSSFVEYLGPDGISTALDDKPGRIANTANPLDLALASRGYFQIQTKEGIKLTRDGRFKLDKNGNLLTLDDSKVLADTGIPIKLHIIPEELKDIVVNTRGSVSVLNKSTKKLEKVANLGIVDSSGVLLKSPDVKQGYNEYSNVSLESEFMNLMVPIRNFDANRQIFIMESSVLSKTISQLTSS